MGFIGGEVIPVMLEVGALASTHQGFRRGAVEPKMPDGGIGIDILPAGDAGEKGVQQRKLFRFRRKLRGIGVGHHQTDIVADNSGLPDAQREQIEKMMQAQEPLIKRNAPWNMAGYQLDLDYANVFSGQLYEQDSKRFIITFPGTVVEAHDGGKNLVTTLASPEQIRSWVKPGEWNQVEIIADGHLLVHLINGHMMSMTIDNDSQHFSPRGLIGLEIEGPGVLKISHRNIWLKDLP